MDHNTLKLSLHVDDIIPCCGRIWHETVFISAALPVHQCRGSKDRRHHFHVGPHSNVVKLELLPVLVDNKTVVHNVYASIYGQYFRKKHF